MPATRSDEDEALAALADARGRLQAGDVPDLARVQRLVAALAEPGLAVLDELQHIVNALEAARVDTGASLRKLHEARVAGVAYARQSRLHR
ncbi:MAG: hypothetical protein U1E45_02140 [Geminicoccaceae bacterium]